MKRNPLFSQTALSFAGLILCGSLALLAQPGPGPDNRPDPQPGGPDRPIGPPPAGRQFDGSGLAARLGPGVLHVISVLTPEQRRSFRESLRDDRENLREFQVKMKSARQHLMQTALDEKFDEKAVRKQAMEVAKLEAEQMVRLAKALSQVEPPLTSGQRERLENPPPMTNLGPNRGPFMERRGPPQGQDFSPGPPRNQGRNRPPERDGGPDDGDSN